MNTEDTEVMYVGIDISKDRLDVDWLGQVPASHTYTAAGLAKLVSQLQARSDRKMTWGGQADEECPT